MYRGRYDSYVITIDLVANVITKDKQLTEAYETSGVVTIKVMKLDN